MYNINNYNNNDCDKQFSQIKVICIPVRGLSLLNFFNKFLKKFAKIWLLIRSSVQGIFGGGGGGDGDSFSEGT